MLAIARRSTVVQNVQRIFQTCFASFSPCSDVMTHDKETEEVVLCLIVGRNDNDNDEDLNNSKDTNRTTDPFPSSSPPSRFIFT